MIFLEALFALLAILGAVLFFVGYVTGLTIMYDKIEARFGTAPAVVAVLASIVMLVYGGIVISLALQ